MAGELEFDLDNILTKHLKKLTLKELRNECEVRGITFDRKPHRTTCIPKLEEWRDNWDLEQYLEDNTKLPWNLKGWNERLFNEVEEAEPGRLRRECIDRNIRLHSEAEAELYITNLLRWKKLNASEWGPTYLGASNIAKFREAVWKKRKNRDLYTGWSKEDYAEARYKTDVDHIVEVQIIYMAIMEVVQTDEPDELEEIQHHLFDLLNRKKNLNNTHNILNTQKGQAVKSWLMDRDSNLEGILSGYEGVSIREAKAIVRQMKKSARFINKKLGVGERWNGVREDLERIGEFLTEQIDRLG